MNDEGVMSFVDIAEKLGITYQEVQLLYESAMRKILRPQNKQKIRALIAAVYGESCVDSLIRNGSWRVKKIKKV